MFYRVYAILNFTEEDEAADFYHDCEVAILKSQTINPGQPDAEQGYISLQHCYHDEHPGQPCDVIEDEHTP